MGRLPGRPPRCHRPPRPTHPPQPRHRDQRSQLPRPRAPADRRQRTKAPRLHVQSSNCRRVSPPHPRALLGLLQARRIRSVYLPTPPCVPRATGSSTPQQLLRAAAPASRGAYPSRSPGESSSTRPSVAPYPAISASSRARNSRSTCPWISTVVVARQTATSIMREKPRSHSSRSCVTATGHGRSGAESRTDSGGEPEFLGRSFSSESSAKTFSTVRRTTGAVK